ncbi:MAG: S8 family serine peptidase [Verrucomicrobiota bacterium]
MRNKSFLLLGCAFFCVGKFTVQAEPKTNFFHFRAPHSLTYRLEENIAAPQAAKSEWVKVFVGKSTNAMELGSRIVIQLKPGADVKKLTAGRAAKLSRTVTSDVFILQAPDAMTAMREAEALLELPDVTASYPVMRRSAELQGAYAAKPNDQYFAAQWNLEDRNASGAAVGTDLNVRAAWPLTQGEGVTIAVADVGLELAHIELAPRAIGAPHFNFTGQSTNVTPAFGSSSWAHATEVAGLAVAEINNGKGMAGVAPRANLASWVIFTTNQFLASDEQLMDMYQYASNTVAVQNHSWGNFGLTLDGPSLLEQIGISNALTSGRFGRGIVMVRSAGNSRLQGANCNDDGYPSDPRVIAVGAIFRDGRPTSYTEPGACVLVAAPSGDNNINLFTTDLLGTRGANQIEYCPPFDPNCPTKDLSDYVFNSLGFSGTSAAAPEVAGIAALILSANTNLTYRDVQQILIFSARHFAFVDPDLITNGAGFRVSHNLGFGVPDAGAAVNLARSWSNRPPLTNVKFTATNSVAIPDDGLRLLAAAIGTPQINFSIRTLPSVGIQTDVPTAIVPLTDVGGATNTIAQNLTNKAALIQRTSSVNFSDQINRAAQAGATFAVVFNSATNVGGCPGGDQLCNMGGTDYVPIPAVFIGFTDGSALKNLLQQGTNVLSQLKLQTTNYTFFVTNSLICEHVGVRVKTDHPLRGDLRITLVSPQGTRSVLQRFNGDTSAGPVDWTYYSTHHFYESSAGTWTVSFGDEFAGNFGNVQSVSLEIKGVSITDNDEDGLDDVWELTNFGWLASEPTDDLDKDGNNNAREQILRTNPNAIDVSFRLDLSQLDQTLARLSWPGSEAFNYEVQSGPNVALLTPMTNVAGKFPETEWFTPFPSSGAQFFRVRAVSKP